MTRSRGTLFTLRLAPGWYKARCWVCSVETSVLLWDGDEAHNIHSGILAQELAFLWSKLSPHCPHAAALCASGCLTSD